ncbi:MAG: PDZ domain-containing protein [Planctomycetales bacterium]|nr:PDZ domain-containing protein [Planctomycetales bacterium]
MSLSLSRLFGFAGSGLAAAAFAFPLTAAFAQEEREIVIQRVILGEKESDEKGEKEDDDDDDDDKEKGGFWIGVALRGTEGADGLTIAEVFPDSPALKAELKAGDVLVAIGDKKLERLEQLMDAVQDSQGKTLQVKFLREGKEQVRELKPGKRPAAFAIEEREEKKEKEKEKEGKEEKRGKKDGVRYVPKPGQPGAAPGQPGTGWRVLEVAPKTGAGPQGGSGTMHLYTVPKGALGTPQAGGGSAFPPGVPWGQPGGNPGMGRMTITAPHAQLPDDMEVSISKKGNKPAVIVAKQGDKLWKTTENELDMLPPPAQAYASRLLGKDVTRARMPAGGNPGMMPGMGGGMGMPGMPGMGGMPGMPAMGMGGTGAGPAREMRRMELRLNKDGTIKDVEGTKNPPHFKVLPGGGIQVEIREGAEGKEGAKSEKKGSKSEKPAAEKEDGAKAERIRSLQLEAEKLRGLLNKLREQVKEKATVEEKK